MRDVLVARPAGDADDGAQWFFYARRENHQDMAVTFARSVFGMQVDCAQCHDHPLAGEILQKHY